MPEPGSGGPPGAPPAWCLALGALVLGFALTATALGAGAARRPLDARDLARSAVLSSVAGGSRAPEVRDALVRLRREIGRRPRDARSRAVYATLVLGLSRDRRDTEVAAFHARRAAALAPVTVPVVRYAVHVLVRTGDLEPATSLLREMFGYDPAAAADLLLEVEGLLSPDTVRRALVDSPEAYLAWASRLRERGRGREAESWLAEAVTRWPRRPDVRLRAVARRHDRADWPGVLELVGEGSALPEGLDGARLLAYRARARAESGDPAGARRDVEAARRSGSGDVRVQEVAGGAYESLGSTADARSVWSRALHLLPEGDRRRLWLRVRLARLEERDGSAAAALRHWRVAREIDPGHDEARRAVERLTGR